MIKVTLLGGGNLASHLAKTFLASNQIELVQIYNRTIKNIEQFKNKTLLTNNLKELKTADIYIISISDNEIANLSAKLNFPDKLVVHTSGAMPLNEIKAKANKGVFYPLQSFSKNKKVDFKNIPICIEANKPNDLVLLEKLASAITNHCYFIDTKQRETLHVAAVFVNNFVNHLYHLGNGICNSNNIPFEILQPLIKETASKITNLQPFEAQTGPAKRNDTKTINKHLEFLSKNNKEIYQLLSNSITKTYGEKL
ncbi:NADP oxidoreductase coenzyme F420-dependent [Lutibacter oricola]|uniref:NADP oxidoreductase coenzyme F420-dependent n=1 Tax=Lutibacter oricola TaxID=762486 RepID=A0A1H2W2Y2_9FLAO|nr:DUF2520 domain-containing protein [Lutibacter oricola]SDW74885.1 NADP oxidoreductase coenzyme F420-dependent [Lutibacter oricola]